MLDRLTAMRVFVAAVTEGSLSRAARALGLSAAMATRHLDQLEARLGARLLHRSTRRLALTETGARYFDDCQRILADVDEADARAASQPLALGGELRMSAPLSFGVRHLAPMLPDFLAAHPALHVEIGFSDDRADLVMGRWDLGLRIGRLDEPGLQARKLADCPLYVCAAPDYLRRNGRPDTVADLSRHACLTYSLSRDVGSATWSFGADGRHRVRIHGPLTANNGDALVQAAIAGQGIVYQPAFIVADALRAGQLISLELDLPTLGTGGIHAVYPAGHASAKIRAMVGYLVGRFAAHRPWELTAQRDA